jgi:hypothetical protein
LRRGWARAILVERRPSFVSRADLGDPEVHCAGDAVELDDPLSRDIRTVRAKFPGERWLD